MIAFAEYSSDNSIKMDVNPCLMRRVVLMEMFLIVSGHEGGEKMELMSEKISILVTKIKTKTKWKVSLKLTKFFEP